MSLLRGVVQDDTKGCGVACVATVTGLDYWKVRKRAKLAGDWRESYGMNGRMLQSLLDRLHRTCLGVTMGQRQLSKLAIVKVTGVVRCVVMRNGKAERRTRLWMHWVVWHAGTVWDPGHGVLWDGNGAVDGMRLYLASVRASKEPRVTKVRTGRWHWI